MGQGSGHGMFDAGGYSQHWLAPGFKPDPLRADTVQMLTMVTSAIWRFSVVWPSINSCKTNLNWWQCGCLMLMCDYGYFGNLEVYSRLAFDQFVQDEPQLVDAHRFYL